MGTSCVEKTSFVLQSELAAVGSLGMRERPCWQEVRLSWHFSHLTVFFKFKST